MLMITCEDIRELAQFQYNDDDNCVLSFYFQPRRPQNKSHREEAILAKDLVREALHGTEKNGKNKCARADLQRILDLAGHLHGNQARAKAVFACGTRDFWREYDLPPQLPGTQLFVNRRFHLSPSQCCWARILSYGLLWSIAIELAFSIYGSMSCTNTILCFTHYRAADAAMVSPGTMPDMPSAARMTRCYTTSRMSLSI